VSRRILQCQRCGRHWNRKHNGDNCPECGWYAFTSDTPATPEQLQQLVEKFNVRTHRT
jgi:predicted  nucleic acid-binding Zn-ribbon protein